MSSLRYTMRPHANSTVTAFVSVSVRNLLPQEGLRPRSFRIYILQNYDWIQYIYRAY
jgi:hypothetical protein